MSPDCFMLFSSQFYNENIVFFCQFKKKIIMIICCTVIILILGSMAASYLGLKVRFSLKKTIDNTFE